MVTTGNLSALYQNCSLFYATPEQRPLASQLDMLQQLAQQTVKIALHNPLLLLSQLSLTPAEACIPGKVFVKQSALLTALALAGRWQEDILLLLFKSAALTALPIVGLLEKADKAEELSKAEQQQLKFPAMLLLRNHRELTEQAGVFLLLSQCYGRNKGLAVWQTPYLSQMLSYCWKIARLMLPGAGKLIALEKIAAQLLPQATSTEQEFWQALACLHSASYSTGRFVRDSEANLALVLCEIQTTLQPQLLLQPYDKTNKQLQSAIVCQADEWQLLNPRLYHHTSWLDGWQQKHQLLLRWPERENLPAVSWLQQLSQAAKVSIQAELIEQQPWLIEQLLQQASLLNRQQLVIHSTQHAIALVGQDKLLPLLKQAWLKQHCILQNHPHQAWLLQFRKVLAKALFLLTQNQRIYLLSTEQSELLAWCLCWPLWQQSELRTLALSGITQPKNLLSQWVMQQLWQSEHYQQLALNTLKHMQLELSWQNACLHYRALPDINSSYPLAFILAFALDLTTSVFSAHDQQHRLQQSYKFARLHLEQQHRTIAQWLELLVEQSTPQTELIPSCSFISPFTKAMPQELTDLSQISA